MGRKALAIAGGLLQGVGEGVMLKSSNRQKDAIAKRDAIIANLKGGSKGSMTDSQKYNAVVKSHTTTGLDGETTDWPTVIDIFEKDGRKDFMEMARQGEQPIDENSDAYLSAEAKADEWIDAQAGYFSTDSSDFKAYGGNREQARQAKIREFLTGDSSAATTAAPATSTASATSGTYNTVEEVGAAYMSGKISKAEADKILIEQFGAT